MREKLAEIEARSTCPTRPTGAVLVGLMTMDRVSGYEGAARGQGHCDIIGCHWDLLPGNECLRAIHAELNAIFQAARIGQSTIGACLYISRAPHPSAIGAIINAGIGRVVYDATRGQLAPHLQSALVAAGVVVDVLQDSV